MYLSAVYLSKRTSHGKNKWYSGIARHFPGDGNFKDSFHVEFSYTIYKHISQHHNLKVHKTFVFKEYCTRDSLYM